MRLIDAGSFKAQLIYLANHMQDNGHATYAAAVGEIISILDRRQTIDAVPVVRCKDCKWWGLPEGMYATENVKHCEFGRYMVGANGYCVYGEVKDDAD